MNELSRRNDILTDCDEYSPTPSEERLILARLNPENLGKSITDLCTAANVSRQFFYSCMRKPQFVELLNRSRMQALKNYISDIIDASYRTATTCGSRGFQDRKMLLELAGIYKPEQNFAFAAVANNGTTISEAELEQKLQKLIAAYKK